MLLFVCIHKVSMSWSIILLKQTNVFGLHIQTTLWFNLLDTESH